VAALTLPASVAETVDLIRSRAATATELAELSLDAIEQKEAQLNAFTTILRESSLRSARRVDEAITAGLDPGALAGVPFAVKDGLLTIDAPTTAGSSVYRVGPASPEATAVSRLRQAGAILVGKTNMNEFGWGLDPSVGPVANPRAPGRSAGGSSGGSAAAVAAGSVVFALGTDAGGSVRMPAAFCGVTGLKPTHMEIPYDHAIPSSETLTDVGPIATTASDLRIVFDVLAGGRPSLAPEAPPRLGIVADALTTCKPEVAEPVAEVIEALDRRGWTTDVTLNASDAPEQWLTIFTAETAAAAIPTLRDLLPRMSADLRRLVADGQRVLAVDYLNAISFGRDLTARIDRTLNGLDAIVTPTVPSPAPEREPEWEDEDFFGDMRWTVPASLTGHPAITLPAPNAALPAGVQLIGRHGSDDRLLRIAELVQTALEQTQT
jgi:aspartyl-tRNA(Asn)/glutamyl-tRNA(Gln) amidotransferase subunit A